MNEKIIEITDYHYFWAIDNSIRQSMKTFETNECLPKCLSILRKSNITMDKLKDYPIEGYYYETPKLTDYLKIIRNIQHNEEIYKNIVDCEELDFIKRICNNDLFGVEDPKKRENNSPLKRRYDILTLTMEDESIFNPNTSYPWSIDSIVNNVGKLFNNRVNLTEFAYLINDPRCLCAGAETNSLYRAIAFVSGCWSDVPLTYPKYVWNVSKVVEEMGIKIIDQYNLLYNNLTLTCPNLENISFFNINPKLPRVALLGYVLLSNEYYHWILTNDNKLEELYSKEILTTEKYEKNIHGNKFDGNIFNLK